MRHCEPLEFLFVSRDARFVRDVLPGTFREQTLRRWTHTRTGLCVDALLLPGDARAPVRVESMPVRDYAMRKIGDSPPAIDADYDVYLGDNRLLYVKERCGQYRAGAPFFLHLYPADANDLPEPRFDNLDFNFDDIGLRVGWTCLAEVPLPDYRVSEIRTGQYIRGGENIWEGEIRLVE